MKRILQLLPFFIFPTLHSQVQAQCAAGSVTTSLNWDALDYYSTAGYTGYPLTATLSPNQNFAFGKGRLNITYSGCTSSGENATHTGSTSTYGGGDDVQYNGNGTITINFSSAVTNVKFSIHDIDKGHVMTFSATNNGVSTPVTLTKASASSTKIGISGSVVSSLSGNEGENDNLTTVNVDIAGPVTSVTMVSTNTNTSNGGSGDSEYWLSDISACTTSGSFPSNYYQITQPFTGMPGYVLVAVNKGVYMVNTTTGVSKLLFTDGATSGTINSLAYDPYNNVAYYCWSLTNNGSANASEKTLRKYDFKTNTASTLVNDVNSINLPSLSQGVESGAAAFYDGALYIGIEGGSDNGGGGPRTSTSGRESVIWRIDFNNSGTPTMVTQVYAVSGDTHDWSDFSINNGMLYDFNGDASTPDYYHINLQTGAATRFAHSVTTPRQSAVGWDGTIYWLSSAIAPYNLNGSIGTQVTLTANPTFGNFGNTGAPSFGDGGEAFRPAVDFGDAPASFDPDPLSPALHEVTSNLSLGATVDVEWTKPTPGSMADVDGGDEDGLDYASILVTGSNYQKDLKVYNNTGANATVCAWVDFNNDGIFQASEGISQTVVSSSSIQTISLFWNSPVSSIPNNSYTYLRIRITSAANGMTVNNPTGYLPNGEVEDYRVIVSNQPLSTRLNHFSVQRADEKVKISWVVADQDPGVEYTIQKSGDRKNWKPIYTLKAVQKQDIATYEFVDAQLFAGDNLYQLLIKQPGIKASQSEIKKISINKASLLSIHPNPANDFFRISYYAPAAAEIQIQLFDVGGKMISQKKKTIQPGHNETIVPVSQFKPGMYHAEIWIDDRRYSYQLLIKR
jgi:hypothetical protein